MKEKKEFMIPKNYNTEFEIIKNVNLKDLRFFIPSIILEVMLISIPIFLPVKIIVSVILFFIPFTLIFIRPVRENVPAWKHIHWSIQYRKRQTVFYYRKEGVKVETTPKKPERRTLSSKFSSNKKR